jgi:hypothetical protein
MIVIQSLSRRAAMQMVCQMIATLAESLAMVNTDVDRETDIVSHSISWMGR